MPMSETLHKALTEKVTDTKVEVDGKSVTLMGVIEGWFDKQEAAVKIQDANKELADLKRDLKAQIETKDKELGEIKVALTAKTRDLEKAVEDKLTPDDKKEFMRLKERGMTAEMEAKLNTAMEEVRLTKDSLDKLGREKAELSQTLSKTSVAAAQEALKNRVFAKLSDHGIAGRKAEVAFLDLMSRGHIKVIQDDAGKLIEQYRKISSEGKELESSFENVVREYATATENAYLRAGSPRGGTGDNHRHSEGGGGERPTVRELLRADTKGYDNQT